jgi:hypothetical protein
VNDALIGRDRNGSRRVDDALDVALTSLSRIATMPCEFRLRT